MASESQFPEQEYVSARKMIPSAVVEVLKRRMSDLAKSITLKEPPKWLDENAHPINVVINRRIERERHTQTRSRLPRLLRSDDDMSVC